MTVKDLQSWDVLLSKLRTRTKNATPQELTKLADWLEKFRTLHDEVLWSDTFLQIEQNQEEQMSLA